MNSISSSTEDEALFDDTPTVSQDRFNGVEETLAKLAHRAASDTPDPRSRGRESETKPDKSAAARIAQPSAAPILGPATLGPATLGPATLGPATSGPAMLGLETLGPADLRAQIPREQPSRGKRGTLAGIAIALCLCAAATWAWRSYGGPARDVIAALTSARPTTDQPPVPQMPNPAPDPAPVQAAAPPAVEPSPPPVQTASAAPPATTAANEPAAPSADHQQLEAMARDVATLRQTVEQLTAGQAQLKGEIARLEAEKSAAEKSAAEKPPTEKPKKRVVRHVPPADHPSDAFNPALDPNAPGAPRTIGSVVVRGGAPPYSSGVSTLGPVSPPPPPASPGPPRPPMPVQQP